MKKKILFIAAIAGASFASLAQDDKVYTPEAGEWVIGFDANPALNYVGNMFNGTTGNSLNTNYAVGQDSHVDLDQTLYGKYYQDATTAFRGSLRISSSSSKMYNQVDTNTVNSNPSYYSDEMKTSSSYITIGGGIEKRKGEGKRFQGYYGGELLLGFGGASKANNTYANAMDSANVADGFAGNGRVLNSKTAGGFGLTLRGFAGVEYFVFPKISLGAEFGWGLGMSNTGEGETVTENWGLDGANATTNTAFEVTTTTAKSSSFGIDTDNVGGRIKLLFHF